MNPASETRAKAQERWPGATVAARGRNWIRHQHPTIPGKFMLDTSIGPIHYGANEDQEIDTAWVSNTTDGFTHAMTANDFTTRVRANLFNAGNIFRFEMGGQSLVFDPQSISWIDENTSRQQIAIKQAVAGSLADDTVTFPAAYGTGIDFAYQNQTARLQKLITIDQFSRLPAPTVTGNQKWFEAEFTMTLSAGIDFWIDGVKWARTNGVRVQTANMIEVRNTAGTDVLWWIGYPKAWDADENETIGQLEVRRSGGPTSLFITVRIPYEWMAAAVYPVTIDPTIDYQVAAGADDWEWWQTSASFNAASSYGYIGNRSSPAWGPLNNGSRFTIPAGPVSGDTVDVAYVQYWGSAAAAVLSNLNGVDANDPAAPTTYSEAETATRTTASVTWDFTITYSAWNTSPSIVSIIQELWDSGYGLAGEHIIIYHEDDGTSAGTYGRWYAYEQSSTYGGKLHIEYTAASSGLSVSKSDAIAIGESKTVVMADALATSKTDAIAIGESVTAVLGDLTTSHTDAIAVGESVTVVLGDLAITQSDDLEVGESVTVSLPDDLAVDQSDGITVGESIAVALDDLTITQSDDLAVGEAVTVTLPDDLTVTQSDALAVGEVVTLALDALLISQSDAIVVGEAVDLDLPEIGGIEASASDSIGVGESVTVTLDDLVISQSDAVTVDESVTVTLPDDLTITQTDALSVGEAVTVTLPDDLAITQTDALAVGESVTATLDDLEVDQTDALAVGESVSVSLPVVGTVEVSTSDALAVGESVTIALDDLAIDNIDALAVGEVAIASLPEVGAIEISVSDSLDVGESVAATLDDLAISLADAVTVDDSATSATGDLAISAGDDIVVSDSGSSEVPINLSASDALEVGDSVGAELADALFVTVADGIAIGDTPSLWFEGAAWQVNVSDGIEIGESLAHHLFASTATDRTLLVNAEAREYYVEQEIRKYTVGQEERVLTI